MTNTKPIYLAASDLVRAINEMVRAGFGRDHIIAQVESRANFYAGNAAWKRSIIEKAFKSAIPLNARDAHARAKKAAYRESMAGTPDVRGTTRKQDQLNMLREMARRVDFGFPVSRHGFPPFKPEGEKLVKAGLATVRRSGSHRSITTMLHITDEGRAVLARFEKKKGRRDRKFA